MSESSNTQSDDVVDGYESWSKDELQTEAENRGLPVSGTKAEIIERLEASDAEDASATTDNAPESDGTAAPGDESQPAKADAPEDAQPVEVREDMVDWDPDSEPLIYGNSVLRDAVTQEVAIFGFSVTLDGLREQNS